ncbi:MAG: hypothetical protein AAGC60_13655 [Acidobacteriota bacterium]
MRRPLKLFLFPLVLLLSLGFVTWAGADESPAALQATPDLTSTVESDAQAAEVESIETIECPPIPGATPAFGEPAPVFTGDVCVGSCKSNSDCDQYCGPGDGGCDLNPANPCYRQCICLF